MRQHALDPVSISGLTLTHGGSTFASVDDENASLTLSRMVITKNASVGISSAAKLLLADSTVSDNSAVDSGFAGGINVLNGDADIRRSIISGNSGDFGGGI